MPIDARIPLGATQSSGIGELVMNFANDMERTKLANAQNARQDKLFGLQERQFRAGIAKAKKEESAREAANLALRLKDLPREQQGPVLQQYRAKLAQRQQQDPSITFSDTDQMIDQYANNYDAFQQNIARELEIAYANGLAERGPDKFDTVRNDAGELVGQRNTTTNQLVDVPGAPAPARSQALQEQMQAIAAQRESAANARAARTIAAADRRHAARPAAGGVSGPKLTDVSSLRKEFNSESKDWVKISSAADKLLATEPTPAGDISLVFAFMKMIDPASTVREGEVATVEKAGNVPDYIRNTYNRVIERKPLTPAQRQDFKNQAQLFLDKERERQEAREAAYTGIANRAGMDPKNVVRDLIGKHRPKKTVPAAPTNQSTGRRPPNVTSFNGTQSTLNTKEQSLLQKLRVQQGGTP